MTMPPTGVEPSELWRLLSVLPRPHNVVDYPRLNADGTAVGQLAIWVLTQEEQAAAAATAEATTRRLLKLAGKEVPREDEAKAGYRDVYENECAVELLSRACRNVADLTRPAFPSTRELRQLSSDEVGVLVNYYFETQAKVGPIVSRMDDDEYNAWVELLATGAGAYPLGRLSWGARSDLIVRLAKECWFSRIGSISSGEEPDLDPNETPIDPEAEDKREALERARAEMDNRDDGIIEPV